METDACPSTDVERGRFAEALGSPEPVDGSDVAGPVDVAGAPVAAAMVVVMAELEAA